MPLVEITVGQLEEQQKRQIARGISRVLTDAGLPEDAITIIFRHISGKDVALGGGRFPYWPETPETTDET